MKIPADVSKLSDYDRRILDSLDDRQMDDWLLILDRAVELHTGPSDYPPYVKAKLMYEYILGRMNVINLVVSARAGGGTGK